MEMEMGQEAKVDACQARTARVPGSLGMSEHLHALADGARRVRHSDTARPAREVRAAPFSDTQGSQPGSSQLHVDVGRESPAREQQ